MKNFFYLIIIFSSSFIFSAGEYRCGSMECDYFEADVSDKASLQRGLSTYMNYCYGCHSLNYSRYKRVAEDLLIPLEMYENNLIFDGSKIGELMEISMTKQDAINWLGAYPPDLTLEARLRRPDWIYTYLRNYYPDSSRPYGVNNRVYQNVNMPHVLEDMQNTLSESQYDQVIYDLTNFMTYVADPSAEQRKRIGTYVLLFLIIFTAFAYMTYREFKKDLK
ncbi:MAG: cytochrome c1 [SAR86 cluster bacterium]|uniref:Cytochrome c1 n=1 Tax=SAR86 cluster bacterium TaxID=2030880 RepID=A0A937I3S0_9GAMM|nr:cytochrome c1 [SAR86 cluster bacterium]